MNYYYMFHRHCESPSHCHCESQSDEAICQHPTPPSLRVAPPSPRHCEEQSDEAIFQHPTQPSLRVAPPSTVIARSKATKQSTNTQPFHRHCESHPLPTVIARSKATKQSHNPTANTKRIA